MPQEGDAPQTVRHVFVGMLFALVVADIASAFVRISDHPLTEISWAAIAHLTLGLILVAASWVGWCLSTAHGSVAPIKRVPSVPFLVLLIDVALVIVYFKLTADAENPLAEKPVASAVP